MTCFALLEAYTQERVQVGEEDWSHVIINNFVLENGQSILIYQGEYGSNPQKAADEYMRKVLPHELFKTLQEFLGTVSPTPEGLVVDGEMPHLDFLVMLEPENRVFFRFPQAHIYTERGIPVEVYEVKGKRWGVVSREHIRPPATRGLLFACVSYGRLQGVWDLPFLRKFPKEVYPHPEMYQES